MKRCKFHTVALVQNFLFDGFSFFLSPPPRLNPFRQGVRRWVRINKALLGGEMADAGQEMTSFPQPIELDAVLDTTWEPVAEVVLRKVGVETWENTRLKMGNT
jgi:hypothetical protein